MPSVSEGTILPLGHLKHHGQDDQLPSMLMNLQKRFAVNELLGCGCARLVTAVIQGKNRPKEGIDAGDALRSWLTRQTFFKIEQNRH
jgi:hypothetical protein